MIDPLQTSQRLIVGYSSQLANINLGDVHKPDKVGKFADLPNPMFLPHAQVMSGTCVII